MDSLSNRLKSLREDSGLLQKDIANKLNITTSAYGYYEQGKRKPTPELISSLADLFNVSTDYLLGKTNERISTGPKFSNKDEKDIAKRLAALENDLADQEMTLMMSGEVMDDETRELLKAALQHAVVVSKIKAKEKFNPNKNK